jgi:hypothetical protein
MATARHSRQVIGLVLLGWCVLVGCTQGKATTCDQAQAEVRQGNLTAAASLYARAQRLGEGDCADDGLDQVMSLKSDSMKDTVRGRAAEDDGDYIAALADYQHAIEKDSGNTDALAGRDRVQGLLSQASALATSAAPSTTTIVVDNSGDLSDPTVWTVVAISVLVLLALITTALVRTRRREPLPPDDSSTAWVNVDDGPPPGADQQREREQREREQRERELRERELREREQREREQREREQRERELRERRQREQRQQEERFVRTRRLLDRLIAVARVSPGFSRRETFELPEDAWPDGFGHNPGGSYVRATVLHITSKADLAWPYPPGHHTGHLFVCCVSTGTSLQAARHMAESMTTEEYGQEGLYDTVADQIKRGPDIWFAEVPVSGDVAGFIARLYAAKDNWRRLLLGRPLVAAGVGVPISSAGALRLKAVSDELTTPGGASGRVSTVLEFTGILLHMSAGEPRFTHVRIASYTHDLLSQAATRLTKAVTIGGLRPVGHHDGPVSTRAVDLGPLTDQIKDELSRLQPPPPSPDGEDDDGPNSVWS